MYKMKKKDIFEEYLKKSSKIVSKWPNKDKLALEAYYSNHDNDIKIQKKEKP